MDLNKYICRPGGETALPSCMKVYVDHPPTGLWPVPEPEKSCIESSGDPVLDNLRNQLNKFGNYHTGIYSCMRYISKLCLCN